MSDEDFLGFLPAEAKVSEAGGRPLHLFVRKPDSPRFWYVGGLAGSCRGVCADGYNFGEAWFDLHPALASEVWIKLGGPPPGKLDHDSVDRALARLGGPLTADEKLQILQQLVEYWHGPIAGDAGWGDEELDLATATRLQRLWSRWTGKSPSLESRRFTIPYLLRLWYRWAGRRTDILSGQDFLLAPDELAIEDGLLRFYVENQGCYYWATATEGDDPPVFGREEAGSPWQPEGITLGEHLILACLFNAIICHSPYGAWKVGLAEVDLLAIIERIPPIAINPWRTNGGTRFYAKAGAFMCTMFDSIYIGAKTEHPLQFLRPMLNSHWDYVGV